MATAPRRRTAVRRAAVTITLALAAAGAAQAGPGAHSAAAQSPAARLAASAMPLTAAQAHAQAESSGQPVTASAMTTPTSTTTANPDGTFTTDEAAAPVRAWRGGAWVPLDATLHANADGTISPAVTSSHLALSGGGTSPLAVMTVGGRTLTLTWPGTLPAPQLSGATATYNGVLPGVNLVVTADEQGGFSDTLVVTTAAAAAGPALAKLHLGVATTGLTLSARAGGLAAAAAPGVRPSITAQAPMMWDSAPVPANQAVTAGPGRSSITAGGGIPAASGVTRPGAGAHVAAVPVTLAGNILTLSPSASVLTGAKVTYPVYIDPTWHPVNTNASWWTQVDSGFPTTSYWDESSDLQAGYDDWPGNNGMGVARSFVRLPMPALQHNAVINTADLYMEDVWSAEGCTATAAQLWSTTGVSSSTTWNSQPTWQTDLQQQSFAFGSSGCGYYKDDVTWSGSALKSLIQNDVSSGTSGQTFGIRAASETNDLQWKQYHNGGSGYIHLSVTYNYPPNQPSSPDTSPSGGCHTSSANPPVIGNDDVTLSVYASDNDGDNDLSTQFTLYNSDGSTAWNSASHSANVSTGNKATAVETALKRTVIQGLHSDGASKAYTYYWQAQTTDGTVSQASSPSAKCWFVYNPAAPSSDITITVPATGVLGTTITGSFAPQDPCSPTTTPCPASYVYQLGASAPHTVSAGSGGVANSVPIHIGQTGPLQLTVYAVASGGNFSAPVAGPVINGTPPTTPYKDGYFTGGTYPDLLFTGSGTQPSLWLATGRGNGTLNAPVDIGSLGTNLSPGSGPSDWNGAIVLHGDFSGNKVQDVMAYFPATGSGEVIGGDGTTGTLQPVNNVGTVSDTSMDNFNMDPTGTSPVDPSQLVAAGDVSGLSVGTDDLIGISGTSVSPNDYELDLYTGGSMSTYSFSQTLTATAPDGAMDWNNYTLATAGNPDSTVVFALNTATGALYQCANLGNIVAGGTATWTQLSVPWGASPPQLASGDINNAGQTELWTRASGTATAYTVSGTTVSAENAGAAISYPAHDWPLTDNVINPATTATDTLTGQTASLSGGASWDDDDYFTGDLALDGSTGSLVPDTSAFPALEADPAVSLWFQTTHTSEVLVSLQSQPVAPGTTTTGGYNPVMYVGSDGKLNAEWYNAVAGVIVSARPVNDGLWHHAVLATTTSGGATIQTLYIDGIPQGTDSGTINTSWTSTPNLTFGTGYIGGNWPDEPRHGSAAGPLYFNGHIADITLPTGGSSPGVPMLTGAPATFNPLNGDQELYGSGTGAETEFQNSRSPSGGWSNWQNMSGNIATNSSALFDPASGNLEVYATASGGAIEQDSWAPSSGWSGWTSLGGTTAYAPAAVYDPINNSLDVYVTGTTGTGYVNSWTRAGGWTGWQSLGGVLTSGPSAAYDPLTGSMQVFGVGTNGAVYVDSGTPAGGWSGWQSLGGTVSAAPSVLFDPATGHMEAVARNASNQYIYLDYLPPGGSWSGWISLGAPTSANPAAVYDPINNALEVYETGPSSGTVFVRSWTSSGGWGSWQNMSGGVTGSPVPAYDPASGNMEVYALYTDGTPYVDSRTPAGGWSGWTSLGGTLAHL